MCEILKTKEKQVVSVKSILQLLGSWTSEYYKFIILFGILFSILQISDLTTTYHALKNSGIKELNPLYDQIWFVPFKLTMVFLIMAVMYRIPAPNQRFAKKAMIGMIFMYLFINMNNLYFAIK
ncbi:MAG: DUF5658 family protein [Candidatus Methanoperedens sp.]|nr:DUF5658 family protein [Candidatus Methanoperedens sp.]